GIDATADIAASPALAETLALLESGVFSPDDRSRYKGLVDNLRHRDWFLVCADFEAYRASQRAVDDLWRDRDAWWQRAVLNTAGMGWFSSDRTIGEYAREIWEAEPLGPAATG
ncbi:MAG: glycogen/starch/alpha-glucan phosphorylase, partial [Lysobacter sp.]|nr:glycogen/starch/alpha-glucan phosphorylase [Lysobacter sp.]